MVSASVITNLLLATVALAAPSLEVGLKRFATTDRNTTQSLDAPVNNVRNTIVYPNAVWAGAMYNAFPSTFTRVTGLFTVPTLVSANGMPFATAAIAVGIDAVTCQTAIFQAGVDILLFFGEVSYHPWYKWYPDPIKYLSGPDLKAGDNVRLTIETSSSTTGNFIIQNENTKQVIAQAVTSSNALCMQDAAWIVEVVPDSPVDFGNFGIVIVTEAYANTTHIGTVGPDGASIVELMLNNRLLTRTDIGPSSLAIQYSPT